MTEAERIRKMNEQTKRSDYQHNHGEPMPDENVKSDAEALKDLFSINRLGKPESIYKDD